jgi:glutathione-regulated potassium-efflux system ancillary protein KefG
MERPRILWYLFHPDRAHSLGNAALLEAVKQVHGATFVDAYAEFGDRPIDVPAQQGLLTRHDLVVFQHPFYWYSCPPLMKAWIDQVFTRGFAYPAGEGQALRGKHWLSVVTTGALAGAYQPGGSNHYSMAELLRPFQATANLCGMRWHPAFVVHGLRPGTAGVEAMLSARTAELAATLNGIDLKS